MANRTQEIKIYIKNRIKSEPYLYNLIDNNEERIYIENVTRPDTLPELPFFYVLADDIEKVPVDIHTEPLWFNRLKLSVVYVTTKVENSQDTLQEVEKYLTELFINDRTLGNLSYVIKTKFLRSSIGSGIVAGGVGSELEMQLQIQFEVLFYSDT